jgi:hypothetical protein
MHFIRCHFGHVNLFFLCLVRALGVAILLNPWRRVSSTPVQFSCAVFFRLPRSISSARDLAQTQIWRFRSACFAPFVCWFDSSI